MNAPLKFQTVDEYIASFPPKVKSLLRQMRKTIKEAAPEADEVISYNMPGYKLHGMLVYFAGYKAHIGFYAVPSAILAFKKELAAYQLSKGTIRLPLDQPFPTDLVSRIVQFRVRENKEKERLKKKK